MRDATGVALGARPPGDDVETLFTRHFVAQASRPVGLLDVPVGGLHPGHRCLLATDGMVSTTLEAYHLEPIAAQPVSQGDARLDATDAHWLAVPSAATAFRRRVALRGAVSDTLYVVAESLLVPSRLPAGFGDAIDRFPSGLGAALLASGIESRRELLWFGAGTVPDWYPVAAGRHALQRTYRVVHGGEPVALITESFL
ncbi:4-hydroxybenzoate synthetase (chorismate-pyruvate lyase) [Micromonospora pallida]|uniref:4-hydroxybenzoate synthetase (Chorismate-pyruvate lyase) n=1 Tax=Micromonospora pallida TaxID=145854 RepID=A0A1C6RW59_9ACTN|nr:chorismate pyruvate-lyase family protein [Micromonospora pallida]SCL21436.1 4-hydroxybenzoate synthetase (chorismate-pyruvate lyase) [Micromonospora pallida]